jgi:hypothetical protein
MISVCWMLILLLLLIGCSAGESVLPNSFPAAVDAPGWSPAGDVRTFDEETLFDLVNGQAEAFFAYGFERVAVRRYVSADETAIHVEAWQLASPADAYGLFTLNASGAPVEGIGNDSDADPGRRLSFWQDRYFVSVHALQETDNADLETFARFISSALPAGGERPALMDRLPPDGLVERGVLFFHEEISIQDVLWLGGENLLGLSAETDGVLAQYEVDGAVTHLLLIEYPETASASAGLEALKSGEIEVLVAASVEEDVLGAVFGEVDEAAIGYLLEEALK